MSVSGDKYWYTEHVLASWLRKNRPINGAQKLHQATQSFSLMQPCLASPRPTPIICWVLVWPTAHSWWPRPRLGLNQHHIVVHIPYISKVYICHVIYTPCLNKLYSTCCLRHCKVFVVILYNDELLTASLSNTWKNITRYGKVYNYVTYFIH